MARLGSVIAALSLTFCLAACAAAPAAPPSTPEAPATPTASSAPDPTAAADPLDAVTTVILRPDRLDLRDAADATIRELSYDMPATEVAAALSVVFDGEPVIEEYPGSCCESAPATRYHWDGFTVADDHMGHFADHDHSVWIPEAGPDIRDMNLSARATVAEVRGIAITTIRGFGVGSDVAGLAAELGQPYDGGYLEIAIETGPELGPAEVEGHANAYSVVVTGGSPEASGVQLVAPMNLGVGRV